MSSHELPPHQTVEVELINKSYVNICDAYGGGPKLLDKWRELGDLLAHRPGWHFDLANQGDPLWSLGAFGEALLSIHVRADGSFGCLDYIQDKYGTGDDEAWIEARTIAEIEAWLDKREAGARQPSSVLKRLFSEEDWRLLRGVTEFKLKVSWSDGWYLASVRGLPEDATFQKTLRDAIIYAKAMIVRYLDAPDDLASELRTRVDLDERAASHFVTHGE